jgi:hypothetical protein
MNKYQNYHYHVLFEVVAIENIRNCHCWLISSAYISRKNSNTIRLIKFN